MGKFKEAMRFEKENMPEYQYKFLYRGVLPGLIFILGGALICTGLVIIGAVLEIMLLGVIPVCIYACVTVILLILLVVNSKMVSKRLIDDKTEEFEKFYSSTDYEMAMDALATENIIVDGKLISYDEKEPFCAQSSFKLEDCDIIFFCRTMSGKYWLMFLFYKKDSYEDIAEFDMDQNLYTYFAHNPHLIKNNVLFRLFVENKREFVKLMLKYNDPRKMEKCLIK